MTPRPTMLPDLPLSWGTFRPVAVTTKAYNFWVFWTVTEANDWHDKGHEGKTLHGNAYAHARTFPDAELIRDYLAEHHLLPDGRDDV